MKETTDTVIIGAGIIGLCAALQLARRTPGKIVVLEKGRGLGEGSTGASSAVCRAKYTIDDTVALARDGIAAYRHWGDFLELADPVAHYHGDGVLWLGNGDERWPGVEAARLAGLGVAVEVLDDTSLGQRYPALNPCGIAPDLINGEPHRCGGGGLHLLEPEGGYVEPVDALQDLLRALRDRGVQVRFSAEVTQIDQAGGHITGVRLSDGRQISCGTLVNAAGPWCNRIFEQAGLRSPWSLAATRIQIVYVDRPPTVEGLIPVCADPLGGIYFRSQNRGQQIVVGSVLEEDEQEQVADPDDFDRGIDDDFAVAKLHALQHRLPGLDRLRGVKGYSGLYTMNRDDVHPVVGATPLAGFYVANGFSGHGFKLAPSIGSLLAQQITGLQIENDTRVSPSFLAFAREPIRIASRSVLA